MTEFGSGGKAAVAALLSSVVSYVKGSLDLSHDPEVLVRVYCNVRGLSKTYINNGILDSKQDFELFVQGFNKAHPFCDFVDVGEGKERADNKIRGKPNQPPGAISPTLHLLTVIGRDV